MEKNMLHKYELMITRSSIMRSCSHQPNYMEPLRAQLEWRWSKLHFSSKNLNFTFQKNSDLTPCLISDLFHVSECEIDHGDCALLTRHLHRHDRGLHGGLGWLLSLYGLWGPCLYYTRATTWENYLNKISRDFGEVHLLGLIIVLQVIELLIDLGGRLICPGKMWSLHQIINNIKFISLPNLKLC